MTRRIRREDPAYLLAMKEAKVLFEAEMAKSSMKGRGRPKASAVKAVVEEGDEGDESIEASDA